MIKSKPAVFLDMDHTLICSCHPITLVKHPLLLEEAKPIISYMVTIPRPGLVDFLTELNEFAEVYLFTAARLNYAKSVIDSLNINTYFRGIHSCYEEDPNGLANKYNLKNKEWFLVEDTPTCHDLTIYKLQCLGLTNGKEFDEKIITNKVVMINGFHPIREPYDIDDLDKVLIEIKNRLVDVVAVF